MTIYLKKDTASQEVLLGAFLCSSDGLTAKTGLTIANTDIKIWKTGGTTIANKNSTDNATEISLGYYYTVLDDTDTNTAGPLVIGIDATGALYHRLECMVLPAKVYDSLVAGSDNLETDIVQVSGSAVATGTAQLGVNVVSMSTDSFTADAVKTDAVTEIQSGLATAAELAKVPKSDSTVSWNATALAAIQSECNDALTAYDVAKVSDVPAAADIKTAIEAAGSHLALILADTAELQGDWTDAGRLDVLLDKAAHTAADVADAVWDEQMVGHADSGSAGATLSAAATGDVDVGALADAVWEEAVSDHTSEGSAGKYIYDILEDTGTTLDGIVDDILLDTAEIGAAGAGLTAVPWNASWDAEVQSECTDALDAYDPPTNAEMEARTLVATSYFDPSADTVAHVTLCDTCTTNTDMRGTDSAALASVCTELRLAELDAANLPTDVAAVKADTADILTDTGTTLDGIIDDIYALVGGYAISAPAYDSNGNMTGCTITANSKTFTVTATYDGNARLATYEVTV